jgi:hypothetical protein
VFFCFCGLGFGAGAEYRESSSFAVVVRRAHHERRNRRCGSILRQVQGHHERKAVAKNGNLVCAKGHQKCRRGGE